MILIDKLINILFQIIFRENHMKKILIEIVFHLNIGVADIFL